MALRSIIITSLIFVIVVLGALKIYTVFHRPFVHHLNSDLQIVGVIDTDNSHEITPSAILNGDDSLLVVDHASLLYQEIRQKIPQAEYLSQEEVFNVNNLHLWDKNSDGILTDKDPIFDHLYVVHFYDKGQQNDIKSLAGAGIKAISVKNATPAGDHLVLMNDGTSHTLYNANEFEKSD